MGLRVGASTAVVDRTWPGFLRLVDGTRKAIPIQHEEETNRHRVYVVDGVVLYLTDLYKAGSEPANWTAEQVADNTTWREDFLANWLANTNAPLADRGVQAAHHNGTANTTAAEIVFGGSSRSILVQSMGTALSPNLLVSFDRGANWKTLSPGAAVGIDLSAPSCFVKSSSGTVGYEMLVTHD